MRLVFAIVLVLSVTSAQAHGLGAAMAGVDPIMIMGGGGPYWFEWYCKAAGRTDCWT